MDSQDYLKERMNHAYKNWSPEMWEAQRKGCEAFLSRGTMALIMYYGIGLLLGIIDTHIPWFASLAIGMIIGFIARRVMMWALIGSRK
jgi:hypothetical protein